MQDITRAVINKAHEQSLRVFISDHGHGNYGVFSNQAGTSVISFWPSPFGGMSFATCHKALNPTRWGQGVLIREGVTQKVIEKLNLAEYLNRNIVYPDRRPKTLEEHLEFYKSSNYKEVK